MGNLIPGIRNAARALIVRDGHLLLLRKEDDELGERYALPGGAQEAGETLLVALNRECLEEINTEVVIRDLLHVADWFKPRDTIPPSIRQRVEFLFDCTVPENYQPRNGHRPDKHQVGVVWKKLSELQDIQLLPQALTGYLMDYPKTSVSLPRDRFWDIQVPKIDSQTRQPLVPRPPCVRAASPHHSFARCRLHSTPSNGWTACRMRSAYCLRKLRDLRSLRHCGNTLAPTPSGDYAPSLRSPWRAAAENPSTWERWTESSLHAPFQKHPGQPAFSDRRGRLPGR